MSPIDLTEHAQVEHLVDRLQAADEEAFDHFMATFGPPLRLQLIRARYSPAEAEVLAANRAFAVALTLSAGVRAPGSEPLVAWILQEAFRDLPAGRRLVVSSDAEFTAALQVATVADARSSSSEPEPPLELVTACASGECVLFIGSGLSEPAGMPTWGPLVTRLLARAFDEGYVDSDEHQSLQQALDAGETNLVADSVVRRVGPQSVALTSWVRELFASGATPTPIHGLLTRLRSSAVLTTNFDALLETAFREAKIVAPVYTPLDTEELLGAEARQEFFVLKLYGMPERPDSLLVAPAEFHDAVAGNIPFGRFMDGLFTSRTLCFLGCSLQGIDAYLRGVPGLAARPTLGGQPRQHFALVNVAGSAWQVHADVMKQRYGIQVLNYEAGPDHQTVHRFLGDLVQRVEQEVDAGRTHASRLGARLRKVALANIGPFERLDLELDPKVNVLLGDNGVGKTTLLKAIAVALGGKEAEPYAHRIVRSRATQATVELETSRGRRYQTDLFVTDGGAVVVTRPGRPLETESWLALGFPALRHVSWTRSGEVSVVSRQRLSAADLLPLISGDPDTRLDAVKQWIIEREDRARLAPSEEEQDRNRRMLDDFYQVMRGLMPGLDLEFLGSDDDARTVRVGIGGAELPLEAVSQGTASLMGWVGVLLQRLYDLYGDDPDPRSRYVLLLVDEIDAHMHPAWQQSTLSALREVFPNLQLIVTTHSALVAGGMKKSQVWVLSRAPGATTVTIRQPTQDLPLLRADQILTSDLFGLGDTRNADALLERYSELLGKTDRSSEEETEFGTLRRRLQMGLHHGQRPFERQVETAIRIALDSPSDVDGDLDVSELRGTDVSPEVKRQVNELLRFARAYDDEEDQ